MRKVRVNRVMFVVFLVLTLPIVGVVGFIWLGMSTSGGQGSMDEAIKLRPTVEAMAEPSKTFRSRETDEFGIRFENGEWLTGVAKDSHALYGEWFGGGTVVLKDSRGRVRCFLGHVCGRGAMVPYLVTAGSLDACEAKLNGGTLQEQPWP